MKSDPTLESIWKARNDISAKCNFDSKALIEFYKEIQKIHQDKLVTKEMMVAESVSKNEIKHIL